MGKFRRVTAPDQPAQMSFRIKSAVKKATAVHCVESDISNQQFIEDALREKLTRDGSVQVKAILATGG